MPAIRSKSRLRKLRDVKPRERVPLAVRRHPLVNAVEKQLRRCGVLRAGSRTPVNVIIGVSGGADSLALLLACSVLASRTSSGITPLRIAVVHVHHHLRKSAGADASFVRDLCKTLGVACVIEHVLPSRLDGNISANARTLRYAALALLARKRRAKFVLVAHHAEDQFETVLMALCRGAGMHGLAGMKMIRPLDQRVSLVRPLLESTKKECEELCRAAGIRWCDDPSNSDVTKVRARLRRDVLPVLQELWPGAAQRGGAVARNVAGITDIIQANVEREFGSASKHQWPRTQLRGLHDVILSTGLRRSALRRNRLVADDLGQEHLAEALQAIQSDHPHPKQFDWPGGLRLKVTSRSVTITMSRKPAVAKHRRKAASR